jgi:chemotaxis protein MotA
MNRFRKVDRGTLGGIAIAGFGLIAGLKLEGIQPAEVTQLSAACIVLGGTAGAVLMSAPWSQIKGALAILPSVLWRREELNSSVTETILGYARAARSRGLTSLEKDVELIEDPFLRKALQLAVDSVDRVVIRDILEADITRSSAEAESAASIYEAAAGYAPTFGMAGAAFGLVQVMKHLQNIEQVGLGVAAAFVATIYGILCANLLLLPVASKVRAHAALETQRFRLLSDGVLQIAEGTNPALIRQRLEPSGASSTITKKAGERWRPVPAEAKA